MLSIIGTHDMYGNKGSGLKFYTKEEFMQRISEIYDKAVNDGMDYFDVETYVDTEDE